jgi:hypothetical protein
MPAANPHVQELEPALGGALQRRRPGGQAEEREVPIAGRARGRRRRTRCIRSFSASDNSVLIHLGAGFARERKGKQRSLACTTFALRMLVAPGAAAKRCRACCSRGRESSWTPLAMRAAGCLQQRGGYARSPVVALHPAQAAEVAQRARHHAGHACVRWPGGAGRLKAARSSQGLA